MVTFFVILVILSFWIAYAIENDKKLKRYREHNEYLKNGGWERELEESYERDKRSRNHFQESFEEEEHEEYLRQYQEEATYEEERRNHLEWESDYHRETNSPSWVVEGIDIELGRSYSEIAEEDDKHDYEPNCDTCGKEIYECKCCDTCHDYPCQCCYDCKSYPCECCSNCNQPERFCKCCDTCYDYPCQCCSTCDGYPCQCCYTCKEYPCECCNECGYSSRYCKC
jgi:hypothetical protein